MLLYQRLRTSFPSMSAMRMRRLLAELDHRPAKIRAAFDIVKAGMQHADGLTF